MSDLKEAADLTKELIDALKPLADKLGQGAEHIYALAVKDVWISGIEAFIWAGVVVLLNLIYFLLIGKKVDWDDTDSYAPFIVFGIVLVLVSCLIFGSLLDAGLHDTFNPEYVALKDLLKTVTGGK